MGKHKYIETPEKMWELFEAYVKETKSTPRKKMVFVGKDGEQKWELLEKPLTMEGFSVFCHSLGFTVRHYFDNTDNAYEDYRHICSRVKECIRQDQIEGGMVGQYNPSITQRLNGLVDKQQNEVTVTQPLFPDVQKDTSDK